MDAMEILVIILSIFLTIFLILGIILFALLMKVTQQIRRVTTKTEDTIGNVGSMVSSINKVVSPLMIAKVVKNYIRKK